MEMFTLNDEMEEFFATRTNNHISLVKKYLDLCSKRYTNLADILKLRAKEHDLSKFSAPEYEPYVHLTWKYKCRNEGVPFSFSEKEEMAMHAATFHHVKNNLHHPECWDHSLFVNPISFEDRDKPSGIVVNGTGMREASLIEMVCDWSAMSEEHGENGPKTWADTNIGVRWNFSKKQKELIYSTIDFLWNR